MSVTENDNRHQNIYFFYGFFLLFFILQNCRLAAAKKSLILSKKVKKKRRKPSNSSLQTCKSNILQRLQANKALITILYFLLPLPPSQCKLGGVLCIWLICGFCGFFTCFRKNGFFFFLIEKGGRMAYAGGGGGEVVSPPASARVHCSICGKLLPKLDGSKVYRCGDCNAALQGKHKRHPQKKNDAQSL